jgi:hypothetical protein
VTFLTLWSINKKLCWQRAHVVDHVIYRTVKYVKILHPALNQESQQHINLKILWCNHTVLFHARLFNWSWAFVIALVISTIFLLHFSLAQRNGIWKVLKKNWTLQEIVLKLETSRKLMQIHNRQYPKHYLKCSFIITIT